MAHEIKNILCGGRGGGGGKRTGEVINLFQTLCGGGGGREGELH